MVANFMSTTMPVLGALMSADALIDQGFAVRKEKNYEALQMEERAGQIMGAGSHAIEDNAVKYEILMSKALAICGASGAGCSDPTFMTLMANLAIEGERTAQRLTFNFKTRANFLKEQARATRFEGEEFRKASKKKATATLLAGAGQSAINYLAGGKTRKVTKLLDFA